MDSQERDKTDLIYTESDEQDEQFDGGIVSYYAFESVQARNERTIRRMWITTIILIILLFASNALWLYEFTRYDIETYSVDMDAGETGDALYNYIGEDGDIYNGTNTDKTKENDAQDGGKHESEKDRSENSET